MKEEDEGRCIVCYKMSPGSSISYGCSITWNWRAATHLCNIHLAPIYSFKEVIVLFKCFLSLQWSFGYVVSAKVPASRSCQSFLLVCNEVYQRSAVGLVTVVWACTFQRSVCDCITFDTSGQFFALSTQICPIPLELLYTVAFLKLISEFL